MAETPTEAAAPHRTATVTPLAGRRERSKQAKLDRIFEAAATLFAENGYAAVTTQQIADRADVASGTLFRYAATKAELLIMASNQDFAASVAAGRKAAEAVKARAKGRQSSHAQAVTLVDAVVAQLEPMVRASKRTDENTVIYQRELIFGDPAEKYRAEGLAIVDELRAALAGILETAPSERARTAAAVLFSSSLLEISHAVLHGTTVDALLTTIRDQAGLVVTGYLGGTP